ncbi:MAG: 30S ribosomal protein S3 [Alphaproteobacteria bacterium]|jgi:small subunit ribosomal protein S3|nr:30S ribosomal protein S3 [Alphaproteobacteria bacterium]MDP7223579.1 30S ribosomal protein S3 [Alphaproteobacteria bacterium]
MGQKVNPIGLRVGINRTWDSRWFSDRDYADKLIADLKLRDYIKDRLKAAGISKVVIERAAQNTTISIYTARPGVIIGKKGADIETLRTDLSRRAGGPVSLNIIEIRKPELDAQLAAEGVAQQLERRVSFRRAMKRAVQSAQRFGAEGVRIAVSGRLGGADIARTEWYREGRVPLHTLRADLDYGTAEALTTYGIIGVKIWIYKGDILEHDPMARDKRVQDAQTGGAPAGNRSK